MRFSLELAPKDPIWRLKIYAGMAERLGFDTLWLSDHFHNRSASIALAALASITSRIRLGPGVLNPYTTHPALMAQMAATLTEIAPGRVCLGIGAGDAATLESLGIKREAPLSRVREAVETVKRLLSTGSYSDHVRLDFKAWGSIPIYLGVQGPRMMRLAAELADGALLNGSSALLILDAVEELGEALRSFGRRREDFSIEATVITSVDRDGAKARKIAIPYVAFIATGSQPWLLERLGIDRDVVERTKPLLKSGRWVDVQRLMPDDVVEQLSISGSPREVEDKIAEIMRIGLDGVVFGGPLGPKPRWAINFLADVITRHTS